MTETGIGPDARLGAAATKALGSQLWRLDQSRESCEPAGPRDLHTRRPRPSAFRRGVVSRRTRVCARTPLSCYVNVNVYQPEFD